MNHTQKKKFKTNVIQLVIGVILLLICSIYLIWNPAEKDSIISGISVMKEKVIIWIESIKTWQDDLIEKKYALQRYMNDINTLVEQSSCASEKVKTDLEYIAEWLNNDSLEELLKNFSDYVTRVYDIDASIKEDCWISINDI